MFFRHRPKSEEKAGAHPLGQFQVRDGGVEVAYARASKKDTALLARLSKLIPVEGLGQGGGGESGGTFGSISRVLHFSTGLGCKVSQSPWPGVGDPPPPERREKFPLGGFWGPSIVKGHTVPVGGRISGRLSRVAI